MLFFVHSANKNQSLSSLILNDTFSFFHFLNNVSKVYQMEATLTSNNLSIGAGLFPIPSVPSKYFALADSNKTNRQ